LPKCDSSLTARRRDDLKVIERRKFLTSSQDDVCWQGLTLRLRYTSVNGTDYVKDVLELQADRDHDHDRTIDRGFCCSRPQRRRPGYGTNGSRHAGVAGSRTKAVSLSVAGSALRR
jgi:hypothetical protein